MSHRGILALVLAPVTSLGCDLMGLGDPTRSTLLVQHYAAECVGVSIQRCLLVKKAGETEFGFLYDGIEGFQYDWGFVYELEVEEHRVANPPADGSSIRRVLRTQRTRTRVRPGTEFDLVVSGGLAPVHRVAPDRYRYLWWPEFVCTAGVSCEDVVLQLEAGKRIHFRFAHPADPIEPLTVLSWEQCARRDVVFVCVP